MNKSRPVLITFSILAGLQVLTNGTGLSEVVPAPAVFLFGLLVAAVQTGMTFYIQNGVVPLPDVAAYRDKTGEVVAGPASAVGVDITPSPRNESGMIDPRYYPIVVILLGLVAIFVLLAVLART